MMGEEDRFRVWSDTVRTGLVELCGLFGPPVIRPDYYVDAAAQGRLPFTCPRCTRTSAGWPPHDDAIEGYCGVCHAQTALPVTAVQAGDGAPAWARFGYRCLCADWWGVTPDEVRQLVAAHTCPPLPWEHDGG